MTKREYFLLEFLQYLALAVVALVELVDIQRIPARLRLPLAGMLLALGLLYYFWPRRRYHLFLAAESLLVFGLTLIHPLSFLLGFTLSAHAMILFPDRRGALWIALATLLATSVMVYSQGWREGLANGLTAGLGYAAFGYFNYARIKTEAARCETQALLADLQAAHRQLQAYAERMEEMAVVEERNRLAREMHDTLGHRLTVASVQLEGARRLVESDPQRAAGMVATVQEQVKEALSELRRTVSALRSPPETSLPLPVALARLARDFEELSGTEVHLELPGALPDLPGTHRLALYRAVQEALTNVQRHAQASQVWVRLEQPDGAIALQVGDDGTGIPAGRQRAGLGLLGLAERAAQLGGSFTCEARPGGGTLLELRLPLEGDPSHG